MVFLAVWQVEEEEPPNQFLPTLHSPLSPGRRASGILRAAAVCGGGAGDAAGGGGQRRAADAAGRVSCFSQHSQISLTGCVASGYRTCMSVHSAQQHGLCFLARHTLCLKQCANPAPRRLGVVPALLKVLQASRQPLLRAAVAAAFRHLARDGAMRSQLAEAGALQFSWVWDGGRCRWPGCMEMRKAATKLCTRHCLHA